MPDIKCNVTECHYNERILCNAPVIQVDRNGVNKASNSPQTKCDTFKLKS